MRGTQKLVLMHGVQTQGQTYSDISELQKILYNRHTIWLCLYIYMIQLERWYLKTIHYIMITIKYICDVICCC